MSGWTVPVDDATFAAPVTLDVTTTPRSLYAAPPTPQPGCRLIALSTAGAPAVVVRASPGSAQYLVTPDPKLGLRVDGAGALAEPTSPSSTCSEREVPRWGEATLTGSVLLDGIEAGDGEGCSVLRVRPAGGAAQGALAWPLCLGGAKLPFAAGDTLRIETNTNAAAKTRLVRVERAASQGRPRVVLWLFRGDPSRLAQTGWDPTLGTVSSSQQRAACARAPARGCGTVEVGVRLYVVVDQRSVPLEEGESATLLRPGGPSLELHVGRAIMRPLVDARCTKGGAAEPVDVGLVVVERGDRKEPAAVAGD